MARRVGQPPGHGGAERVADAGSSGEQCHRRTDPGRRCPPRRQREYGDHVRCHGQTEPEDDRDEHRQRLNRQKRQRKDQQAAREQHQPPVVTEAFGQSRDGQPGHDAANA